MFDRQETPSFTLTHARIVTPDAVIDGALHIEDGCIAGIGPTGDGHDMGGQFLIPGIVDIHTDHVERHVHPRLGVQWAFLPALMAHDAVVISGGTTTVFDSLSVGASMKRPERREILGPLVDALTDGQRRGMFRADHLLHLRCEISDPATIELVDATIDNPLTRLVSVMDHTPGDRQSPDVEKWFHHMIHDMEVDEAEGRVMMEDLFVRSRKMGAKVRHHTVKSALIRDLPLMSHDDRSLDHVTEAKGEGIRISEFPTTIDAARAAKDAGMAVVAGAPNFLRGGSQSGNVAVAELLSLGLVDILASDYVPRSPLDAAFAIAADPGQAYDLPAALRLVTQAPAHLTGLTDRGTISDGARADLVAIRLEGGQPVVTAAWRAGQQVF